jgi:hypothetical protein
MWNRIDSQEVGLEAATLKRVRNSSLVEWFCADNITGLKSWAEDMDCIVIRDDAVVEERWCSSEAAGEPDVERHQVRM